MKQTARIVFVAMLPVPVSHMHMNGCIVKFENIFQRRNKMEHLKDNNLICPGQFRGGEIVEPGIFHGGEIEPGTFHGGEIEPGTFHGGEIEPGTFHGGEIEPGIFHHFLDSQDLASKRGNENHKKEVKEESSDAESNAEEETSSGNDESNS